MPRTGPYRSARRRLRDRAGHRPGHPDASHGDGPLRRHASVYEPRAGARRSRARRADRRLRGGRDAVRGAHGDAAVYRPELLGDRGEGAYGSPRTTVTTGTGDSAATRCRDPQSDRQEPRSPISIGNRVRSRFDHRDVLPLERSTSGAEAHPRRVGTSRTAATGDRVGAASACPLAAPLRSRSPLTPPRPKCGCSAAGTTWPSDSSIRPGHPSGAHRSSISLSTTSAGRIDPVFVRLVGCGRGRAQRRIVASPGFRPPPRSSRS